MSNYSKKDSELDTTKLSEVIDLSKVKKLTHSQASQLEAPVTLIELEMH